MIRTHKVRAKLRLDVPKFGSRTEGVVLEPPVLEAKWTRNNHLIADELTVTIGWREGGVDPRAIKNARCLFWFFDEALEEFDTTKHLRFTGICKKAKRRLSDSGWVVEMTFHDYTTLFIANKPMKTSGMPEYSDTLRQIWERICDHTGWHDPANNKIVSSVEALKKGLIFEDPDLETKALGAIVNQRFHSAAKPTPKSRASSWDVWQWCVGALGLISYIDRDTCVVSRVSGHYGENSAARAIYGESIYSFEESVDTDITTKGILLKSLDPLTGRTMEAFYPKPGDERIKTRRGAVGKKSEGGAEVTANEVSGEYEEYNRFDITDQTALEIAAEQAYEERSLQEMEGSFHTAETTLVGIDGLDVDLFDLHAGDAIRVEMRSDLKDWLAGVAEESTWGDAAPGQIKYLVDQFGYDEDMARLIVMNINADILQTPVFHIKSIEVDYGPEKFDVEVKFHNLILVDV